MKRKLSLLFFLYIFLFSSFTCKSECEMQKNRELLKDYFLPVGGINLS